MTPTARCQDYPRLFDSTDPTEVAAAMRICRACPLRDGWCLEQLRKHRQPDFTGTWAGIHYNEQGRVILQSCRGCGRHLWRGRRVKGWKLPDGTVQHNADNLCTGCYKRMHNQKWAA